MADQPGMDLGEVQHQIVSVLRALQDKLEEDAALSEVDVSTTSSPGATADANVQTSRMDASAQTSRRATASDVAAQALLAAPPAAATPAKPVQARVLKELKQIKAALQRSMPGPAAGPREAERPAAQQPDPLHAALQRTNLELRQQLDAAYAQLGHGSLGLHAEVRRWKEAAAQAASVAEHARDQVELLAAQLQEARGAARASAEQLAQQAAAAARSGAELADARCQLHELAGLAAQQRDTVLLPLVRWHARRPGGGRGGAAWQPPPAADLGSEESGVSLEALMVGAAAAGRGADPEGQLAPAELTARAGKALRALLRQLLAARKAEQQSGQQQAQALASLLEQLQEAQQALAGREEQVASLQGQLQESAGARAALQQRLDGHQAAAAAELEGAVARQRQAGDEERLQAVLEARLAGQRALEAARRQWQAEAEARIRAEEGGDTAALAAVRRQRDELAASLLRLEAQQQWRAGSPPRGLPGGLPAGGGWAAEGPAARGALQAARVEVVRLEEEVELLRRALAQQKAATAAAEAAAREAQAGASAAAAAADERAAAARRLQTQLEDARAAASRELRQAEEAAQRRVQSVRADAQAQLHAAQGKLQVLREQHGRVAGRLSSLMLSAESPANRGGVARRPGPQHSDLVAASRGAASL